MQIVTFCTNCTAPPQAFHLSGGEMAMCLKSPIACFFGKRHLSTVLDAITYFKRRVVARFELAVAQRDSKEVIL